MIAIWSTKSAYLGSRQKNYQRLSILSWANYTTRSLQNLPRFCPSSKSFNLYKLLTQEHRYSAIMRQMNHRKTYLPTGIFRPRCSDSSYRYSGTFNRDPPSRAY